MSTKLERKRARRETFQRLDTVEALLEHFRIPLSPPSFLLFGDGSGTTWDKSIGFACTLIDMASFDRFVFTGGMSHGTNNIAELMAYMSPLMWLSKTASERPRGTHVRIFSDSQYIVEGFNGENRIDKGNSELWTALQGVSRRGVQIKAHWIPRAAVPLNKLADQLAGMCRLSNGPTGAAAAVLSAKNVYELNPFGG